MWQRSIGKANKEMAQEGWVHIRLESVTTFVSPDNGCFGFGGKPGYNTTRQIWKY